MHISAMGWPVCPCLFSVSIGKGEGGGKNLEEIAAWSSINGTSLPGDYGDSGTKGPKE